MPISRHVLAVCVAVWLGGPAALAQQAPEPLQGREPRSAEVARLFDAYAIVRAQEMLGLTEDQYARFVSRFKALQEVRRRNEGTRLRQLRELMRATEGDATADDAAIAGQLKALGDLDAKAAEETRQAVASVDEVLTVRQQARFRVFENQLERRKLELMMRARQGAPRPMERRQVPRQR